jgi:hypothetical protein
MTDLGVRPERPMPKTYGEGAALREVDLSDEPGSVEDSLRTELGGWVGRARRAGLDDESIEALFVATFRGRTINDRDEFRRAPRFS